MMTTLIRLARVAIPALAAPALSAYAQVAMPGNQPAQISESELVRRLTSTMDSLVAKDEFSGVVSLTRAGKSVFQQAYGMADRHARRSNNMETAFNLGSMNKMFTATAIRQLEAQGKLHQDSTLITYLPDYPNKDVAGRITLRQMIAHRSGIGGDIFSPPPGTTLDDLRHTRDYLKLPLCQDSCRMAGERSVI